MASRVGVALLGTGLFARDVYVNLFKAGISDGSIELVSVWSRSQEAAESYINQFPGTGAVSGDEGLTTVLRDPRVQMVVIVVPVQASLGIVQRALAAGKHVVQEKPVCGTVSTALPAIRTHRAQVTANPLHWVVAENYRYEGVFLEASKFLSTGRLGKIVKLDLVCDLPMDARNKYHSSAWRRDTSTCPGGFLMDSAVHFIAALRLLAHAAGAGEAVSASGHSRQVKEDLSDPDSVVGVVRFGSGVSAGVSISLASHTVRWSLSVVGSEGSLEVSRGGWGGSRGEYALHHQCVGDAQPTCQKLGFSGCQTEFSEFLQLVRQSAASQAAAPSSPPAVGLALDGTLHEGLPSPAYRGSPEEAARDLAVLEALFASSAQGGQAVPVTKV